MTLQHIHGQYPTNALTEDSYDTLLCYLGEQLTSQCRKEGYPDDEAPNAACDALTNTFGIAADQTVHDWLAAAGAMLGVDVSACVGV